MLGKWLVHLVSRRTLLFIERTLEIFRVRFGVQLGITGLNWIYCYLFNIFIIIYFPEIRLG